MNSTTVLNVQHLPRKVTMPLPLSLRKLADQMEMVCFKGRWQGSFNRRPIVRSNDALNEENTEECNRTWTIIMFQSGLSQTGKLRSYTLPCFCTLKANSLVWLAFWWNFTVAFTGELCLTLIFWIDLSDSSAFQDFELSVFIRSSPFQHWPASPDKKVTWQVIKTFFLHQPVLFSCYSIAVELCPFPIRNLFFFFFY